MRSLTIVNVMLSRKLGGVEQAFVDQLIALDKLGHTPIGIVATKAKIMGAIPPHIKIRDLLDFGEWDIFAAKRLGKKINELQPDIIITNGKRAATMVRRANNPMPKVGVTHGYNLEYLLKSDYVLAVTSDLKHYLSNLAYDSSKIFHVPNMIDFKSIEPEQVQFMETPVIGAMGRFVKKKGFDIFIKALALLRDENIKFSAIIAGDGEEKSRLKALSISMNLKNLISFPGWITDKRQFFSAIDIFCLPSLHEPFGIILLEALAANKPTVSFTSEGPKEIGSDNKDMLFAELGNERDLAEKIKLLLSKQTLAAKLAQAGRNMVKQRYSSDVVRNALNSAINYIYDNANNKLEA